MKNKELQEKIGFNLLRMCVGIVGAILIIILYDLISLTIRTCPKSLYLLSKSK